MDRLYARRLARDDDFRMKLTKLCKDYIKLGEDNLNFYSASFDAAHDAFQGYSRLSSKDLEALDRGHPRNFVLPVLSTQITTMATAIASALFADFQTHKTEGRSPEDENASDLMNQLLRWNDEQQPWFLMGFMWTINALLYNRGVFYESYEYIWETVFDSVELDDPEDLEAVQVTDPATGQAVTDPETGEPAVQMVPKKFKRWVKRKVRTGGYNKVYIVSPYDFICDPVFPLYRLQEMRFCGHKKMVPWIELKANSQLSVDDPNYVDEGAVERLKSTGNQGIGTSVTTPSTTVAEQSRTAYERTKNYTAPLGVKADVHDGGITEVYELRIRLIPKDYDIEQPTDEEVDQSPADQPTVYSFRIGNKEHLLSFAMDTFAHDEFPYAVGEPRPSPHYQFTPSWALQLLPMQQHIDYLKNRHQEALANTVGNVFIAKTSKVDLKDFLDPTTEGKIISILPQADGEDINDIIKQVPINDMTKDFGSEMKEFIDFSTMTSGATDQLQGKPGQDVSATGEQSATAAAKTRLGCIAKLLSTQALTPETRRFTTNFQQFQPESMWVRIRGDVASLPKELQGSKGVQITRDTIQGKFDFIAHDGTLPDLDPRAVAAGIRLIEAGGTFPNIFGGKPGDLDLRKLLYNIAKKAGLKVENFIVPVGAPPPTTGGPPMPPPPGEPPAAPAPSSSENLPSQDVGGGLTMPQVGFPSTEPPEVRPQTA
jgi:hypothetical protein